MSNNFGLTTFESDGKLGQLDNSLKAVSNGDTSLGIVARNGVVIATEKKPHSPLVDEEEWNKIFPIASHLGFTYSGIGADASLLARRARKQSEVYRLQHDELIPITQASKKLGEVTQDFTQRGGVRPFGVALLVAGWDKHFGCQLYQVDPSGAWWAWKASAIGKNYVNAKQFLEKRYQPNMELEDAIHVALLTLKEGFDGDVTSKNIQVGVVREIKGMIDESKLHNEDVENNNLEKSDVKHPSRPIQPPSLYSKYEFVILSPRELQDYLDQIA